MPAIGAEIRGPLREACERRRLPETQILGMSAKIPLARLLDAISVIAEGDPVQVELEHLLLVVRPLDLAPEDHLFEFSVDDVVPFEIESVSCKLASEGGGAAGLPEIKRGAGHR